MFRPSDVRRVQAAFDDNLDPPYEAELQLDQTRKTMRVIIMDPDDPALAVAQAIWNYDDSKPKDKQPPDAEVAQIVAAHRQICDEYPARKAAEAIETAEREARQAARAAALEAEIAAARLAEPEPEPEA